MMRKYHKRVQRSRNRTGRGSLGREPTTSVTAVDDGQNAKQFLIF